MSPEPKLKEPVRLMSSTGLSSLAKISTSLALPAFMSPPVICFASATDLALPPMIFLRRLS